MAYAEALQFDAIFWQDFDQRRQMHAFDRVPRIYVLGMGGDAGASQLV